MSVTIAAPTTLEELDELIERLEELRQRVAGAPSAPDGMTCVARATSSLVIVDALEDGAAELNLDGDALAGEELGALVDAEDAEALRRLHLEALELGEATATLRRRRVPGLPDRYFRTTLRRTASTVAGMAAVEVWAADVSGVYGAGPLGELG